MERLNTVGLSGLIDRFSAAIDAGAGIVVSVEAIRERFGERWPRKHEQVDDFLLRTVGRMAGASAMVDAINDVEFIIIQPNVEPLAVLNFATAVLKETLVFFLGEARPEDIRTFQVAGWQDGALALRPARFDQVSEGGSTGPSRSAGEAQAPSLAEAGPILREMSLLFAPRRVLSVGSERPLAISYSLEPVWNVPQSVVTSYAMLPHVEVEATGEFVAVSSLSITAALELALGALEHAVMMIRDGLARGARFAVHVPVPVQGIMAASKRYRLLEALNALPEDVRKLLVLDLCGHSGGLPNSRMSELVTAMAPTCRAVIGRAPSLGFRVREWRGCRLSGISLDCSELDPRDPMSLGRLNLFANDAGAVSKTIIAHALPDRSLALAALSAGFSHLSGHPIQPTTSRPAAVKWSPADLYREVAPLTPPVAVAEPSQDSRPGDPPASSGAGDPGLLGWLNALDGVAYLADADGTIVAAGGTGWWTANDRPPNGHSLPPEAVLGRSLYSQMSGEALREHFRSLHASVLRGASPLVTFEYRCDAPDTKRTMRMSIGQVRQPNREPLALYQSQILSAVSRPWMTVFEPSRIIEAFQEESLLPIITMCSMCERIAWPPQASGEVRLWLEAEDYYAQGGKPDVRVSHTVCDPCAHTFSHIFLE